MQPTEAHGSHFSRDATSGHSGSIRPTSTVALQPFIGSPVVGPSTAAKEPGTGESIRGLISAVQAVEALTDRKEHVLRTVARGRTNTEIGEDLYISLSTVKFHLAGLMTKLGARNRSNRAMWAYETKRVR
jgi:DNA-binding NarL/FixJ family response regulator